MVALVVPGQRLDQVPLGADADVAPGARTAQSHDPGICPPPSPHLSPSQVLMLTDEWRRRASLPW